MQVPVRNMAGDEITTVELPAEIFESKINTGLMWQYYRMQMDNARLGTAKVKTRSEVNRTHAKWYRQKGTGRARHGSRNAPIFVGGGRTFGPKPHKYTKNMPQKMRHAALRSTLSACLRDGQIMIVDDIKIDTVKTKAISGILKTLVGDQTALILVAERNIPLENSVRNLTRAMTLRASYLNVRDLLRFDQVIIPLASLEVITALLSKHAPAVRSSAADFPAAPPVNPVTE